MGGGNPAASLSHPETLMLTCYRCERDTEWLAPDSRCGDCTNWTPEEITGETPYRNDDDDDDET